MNPRLGRRERGTDLGGGDLGPRGWWPRLEADRGGGHQRERTDEVAARAVAGGAARAGKAEEAVTAAAVFARVVERRGLLER
jgi:hypothetical protein